MTKVWRIGYCPQPAPGARALLGIQGVGSTYGNGRWHTAGHRQVIYCGSSRALCQLEKRVHANGATPKDQALLRLEIPDDALMQDIQELGLLPKDWRANQAQTQAIGDRWLESCSALGLWVPSYVEPDERNVLLNPLHPDFSRVHMVIERQPFRFDPRLF